MADQQSQAAPALPAASVIVVRDAERGLEVLMMERPKESAFAPGALVFPGGRVDPADGRPAWRGLNRGASLLASKDLAFRVAAIRELFEEAGLLLMSCRGGRNHVAAGRQRRLNSKYRARVLAAAEAFRTMAVREGLHPEFRRVLPFAHWITPAKVRRRYDTRFYIVSAPPLQQVSRLGDEAVRLVWANPKETLEAWERDAVSLMFPTRLNLTLLARSGSVAEALQLARGRPVIPVTPEIQICDGQPRLKIPAEAGYGITEGVWRDLSVEKA